MLECFMNDNVQMMYRQRCAAPGTVMDRGIIARALGRMSVSRREGGDRIHTICSHNRVAKNINQSRLSSERAYLLYKRAPNVVAKTRSLLIPPLPPKNSIADQPGLHFIFTGLSHPMSGNIIGTRKGGIRGKPLLTGESIKNDLIEF